ncbi:MAG: hypothetical protein ACI8PQ_002472, partial [Planctomycetota bacterium]
CSQAVVAGARFGNGRVVVFGHGALYSPTRAEEQEMRFQDNMLRWLGGRGLDQTRLLILGGDAGLADKYGERIGSVQWVSGDALPVDLTAFDVVLWRSGGLDSASIARLLKFVETGAGVFLGLCPWGVNQGLERRGLRLRDDLPENKFLHPLGLVFTLGTAGAGSYRLDEESSNAAHVMAALQLVSEQAEAGEVADPGATTLIATAIRSLPPGQIPFGGDLMASVKAGDLASVAPRAGQAASPGDPFTHLGFLLQSTVWADAPADDVPVAPGSEFFPGAVAEDAIRMERTLAFPLDRIKHGGWLSTGLYAVAGEPIHIEFEAGADAAGWRLRIGAHRDTVWHKGTWKRWPEVTMERDVVDGALRMTSPFGGLVYFIPPKKARGGALHVTVRGVVEAPYFVLGDADSKAGWLERRLAPGPWAELECEGVILTIPSGAVRELEDPDQLMAFWQSAMDCYPELRGEPQPKRPERMVEDIQISAGWMHAGYPVMTHGAGNRQHSAASDYETLSTEGNWGYFHEFGHNAQKPEWTFAGTGEVTNNLFSLYVTERMTGIAAWDNTWLAGQKKKVQPYLERGAPFDEWKGQPGLALMMYAKVQREFGWSVIQEALAAYTNAPPQERPRSDDEKRDRWLMRLSSATERDLGPYFQRWGMPVSEAALTYASQFEIWLPGD